MNILKAITQKYLKMNRKRTIVTIIGILLSGAMISAVATLAVSFQNFLIDVEIQNSGAWDVVFEKVDNKYISKIQEEKNLENISILKEIGIGENEYSEDEFIRIFAYPKQNIQDLSGKIREGRFPENSDEIALSISFFDNKENEPKIGDKVTFKMGTRKSSDGYVLTKEPKEVDEQFIEEGTKTYTVCGIISRPVFEEYGDFYTSGITIADENTIGKSTSIAVNVKNTNDFYKKMEDVQKSIGNPNIKYNQYVLMYKGVSKTSGFNEMLYSVCGILIVVIMVGSILVIYNSFAISISERKKQFGMLSSIGATKKQIKKMVLYEGALLGIIGIPLGLIAGVGGIGITLEIVNNLLQPMMAEAGYKLSLVVSWQALLISVFFIALTIYMSVRIPAKRASKITPMEAIRQSEDIKVKAKKLKTPKFIRRLFGIQGELALKNLKRSKKRYRTTVISLIISIVLYLVTSGFVGYMFDGFDTMYSTVDYDYIIRLNDIKNENEVVEKISQTEDVKQYSYIKSTYANMQLPIEKIDETLLKTLQEKNKEDYQQIQETKEVFMLPTIYTLNKQEMEEYKKKIGIKELNDNGVILVNYANLLLQYKIETNITNYKAGDKIKIGMQDFSKEEQTQITDVELEIAKVTDQLPFGIEEAQDMRVLSLIVSEECFDRLKNDAEISYVGRTVYIKAKNVEDLEKNLDELEKQYPEAGLKERYNVKEQMKLMKNLKLVIEIFLYGFIALISAIGISNVFNTISTNIALRRREFANLKSIGMTNKQFEQMLDLECIFYGTKALFYGLPIGIVLCLLLNMAFSNMVDFMFKIPWISVAIVVIAVYFVVFVTMLYASKKVKKENIMDVLKEENV